MFADGRLHLHAYAVDSAEVIILSGEILPRVACRRFAVIGAIDVKPFFHVHKRIVAHHNGVQTGGEGDAGAISALVGLRGHDAIAVGRRSEVVPVDDYVGKRSTGLGAIEIDPGLRGCVVGISRQAEELIVLNVYPTRSTGWDRNVHACSVLETQVVDCDSAAPAHGKDRASCERGVQNRGSWRGSRTSQREFRRARNIQGAADVVSTGGKDDQCTARSA